VAGADDAWDFGHGAGFYLDATQAPWAPRWRMESYVTRDLPAALAAGFPWRRDRLGLFGHSMGGHGALTLALRHPGAYRSVSAFAPIAAPMQCPWGVKAFTNYLGDDRAGWAAHDATELIRAGARAPALLVDQGLSDKFLAEQLNIDRFEAACREAGQSLTLRRHAGYDHGYFFIASFVEDHLRFHADVLKAG
jgi:S-formylglutathione hydrolase